MTQEITLVDRHARAWPKHIDCPNCGEGCTSALRGFDFAEVWDLADTLNEKHLWDAHAVAYVSAEHRDRRLDKRAFAAGVEMRWFFVDVEPEGHADRTPAWDAAEQPKIDDAIFCGWIYYETRGGYRLLRPLVEPFPIRTPRDAASWSLTYKAELERLVQSFGIVADTKVTDWTRLFRLPRVVRDGVTFDGKVEGLDTVLPFTLTVVEAPEITTGLSAVHDDGAPASPELLATVRKRLKQHGPAIEGQGGDKHTFEACAIVCRGYALNDTDACALLDEWNASNQPPWDAAELRTKMDNAYNYGSGDIGEVRANEEGNLRVKGGFEALKAERNDPEKIATKARELTATHTNSLIMSLDELTEAPPSVEQIAALKVREAEALAKAIEKNPFRAYYAQALKQVSEYEDNAVTDENDQPFFESADVMFKTADVAPQHLVRNLLMEGGTALIGGEAKSVKTWLATEIAISVATGTPVLGEYVTKAGSVAYFYTEDMRAAIKSRVASLMKAKGLPLANLSSTLHSQPRGKRIDLGKPEDVARVIASVRMIELTAGKVKLLILDPLRNIHDRDEDKSGEMVGVFECIKMIGTLLNCTVLLVHHAKKATQHGSKRGGQKLRGSSAIHGFLDSGIFLDDPKSNDDGNVFTANVESELKAGKSAGKFELTLTIKDDPHTHTAIHAAWTKGAKGASSSTDSVKQMTYEETAYRIVDVIYALTAGSDKSVKDDSVKRDVKAGSAWIPALALARGQGWVQTNSRGMLSLSPKAVSIAAERNGTAPAPHVSKGTSVARFIPAAITHPPVDDGARSLEQLE